MRKKEKRKRYGFLFAALLLLGGVFFVARFFMVERQIDNPPPAPAPVAEVPKVRRAIDGVLVPEGQENPLIAGVMVENMEEAQPISGIADAALVFEAVTEANITRFLTYFVLPPSPQPSPTRGEGEIENSPPLVGGVRGGGEIEIGPVRSARPYFLDWAAEFNTLFTHVGSSPAAYDLLRQKGVDGLQDFDQWYNSPYFFRKAGRPKPHHLYITKESLSKAYNTLIRHSERSEESRANARPTSVGDPSASPQDDEYSFDPWKFKSDASPDLRGDVREITIGYITPYEVTWLYDKALNVYKRVQWSGVHKTAESKELIAKNVAVAFQDMKILDEVGRKEFTTLGQGKGLVFQDGRVVVGQWRKPSPTERMRFYDSQENEVEFNGGATWVEIVPKGYKVGY